MFKFTGWRSTACSALRRYWLAIVLCLLLILAPAEQLFQPPLPGGTWPV